jgi:hypothetical protein
MATTTAARPSAPRVIFGRRAKKSNAKPTHQPSIAARVPLRTIATEQIAAVVKPMRRQRPVLEAARARPAKVA